MRKVKGFFKKKFIFFKKTLDFTQKPVRLLYRKLKNHYDKKRKNRSPHQATQRVDCNASQVTQAFPNVHEGNPCFLSSK